MGFYDSDCIKGAYFYGETAVTNPDFCESCGSLFPLLCRNLCLRLTLKKNITGALEGGTKQAFRKRSRSGPISASAGWNGGVMKNTMNWMLAAAMVAGGLGLAATPAQAARIGIYVRGPVAYVPPCPGPGYVWVAGYYANGYWIPGYWNFPGRGVGIGVRFGGPVERGHMGWGRGPAVDPTFGHNHYHR
jgi:hypothetical protein